MSERARTIRSYVSQKGFVAADGEQATIVEFESEQRFDHGAFHTAHAWRKPREIETLFSEYKVQILQRHPGTRAWTAESKERRGNDALRGFGDRWYRRRMAARPAVQGRSHTELG